MGCTANVDEQLMISFQAYTSTLKVIVHFFSYQFPVFLPVFSSFLWQLQFQFTLVPICFLQKNKSHQICYAKFLKNIKSLSQITTYLTSYSKPLRNKTLNFPGSKVYRIRLCIQVKKNLYFCKTAFLANFEKFIKYLLFNI